MLNYIQQNSVMISALILILSYIFIATEKIPKVTIALLGGAITIILGLVSQSKIYTSKNPQRFQMLKADEKELYQPYLDEMMSEYVNQYGLENVHDFYRDSTFRSATHIHSTDNEWNDWNLEVGVVQNGILDENRFEPDEIVLLHELYHVSQQTPGATEDDCSNFVEIGATIDLIVRNDEIYKSTHGIPMDTVVEYNNPSVNSSKELELGKMANTFREIKEKYNLANWEDVLLSQEGYDFLKENFL